MARGLGIFKDIRFLALVLGNGATMNIGMSVFIWYLTPVILEAGGASISDIGRVMMLFFLIPILLGPYFARLADRTGGFVPILITGLTVSGVSLSSLALWSGFWPMVVTVSFFGVGFSMCDGIRYAQCLRLADASGRKGARGVGTVTLRLTNRLAAIAGLLSAAVLAEHVEHRTLAVAIGGLLLAGGALMLVAEGARALLWRDRVESF